MKKGTTKFRVLEAGGTKHRKRASLDHAASRGAKPETTPACLETRANQDEAEDLARLVVKYFGNEIREAIVEITASIDSQKTRPRISAAGRKDKS